VEVEARTYYGGDGRRPDVEAGGAECQQVSKRQRLGIFSPDESAVVGGIGLHPHIGPNALESPTGSASTRRGRGSRQRWPAR